MNPLNLLIIFFLIFFYSKKGKRYNKYDICAVLSMCVGLVFFTLADKKVQPNFQYFGVFLVCLALVADAVSFFFFLNSKKFNYLMKLLKGNW